MEALRLPHSAPSSFRAVRCSEPTPRSWFSWLPPIPHKPVWPPWKCPWTLCWIPLWGSIGALISYHYNSTQRAKATPIPFVPLLEEATMAASVGVMVIASPLFRFVRPTLPSQPGELPALQNSEITPKLFLSAIGWQVAGCKGVSSPYWRGPSTPEEHHIFNISSRHWLMHDELIDTIDNLWHDVYKPWSKSPPIAFFYVIWPVRGIQGALDRLNKAEWKKGENEFQRRRIQIQHDYIGHIVHAMIPAMQKHIQPVKDIINWLEESLDVLNECSQFMQDHCDFPEAKMEIQRNQKYAHHTRYMIKTWTFGLENLEAASARITALSLEMEKVISGQASIGPLEDLVLKVGLLDAKLARGVMAHHQEMIEFHKQAAARETDDVMDRFEELTPELARRFDAVGKPIFMPMWVWCRQKKSNCYYYWQ